MSLNKKVSEDLSNSSAVVNAIMTLLQSGVRLPMAADEPYDLTIDQIRSRVPAARTVLARCHDELFLIFAEIGDRDQISLHEAIAAMRSDGKPGTLTVLCDLPADVNRLGRVVAEIRGYSIVGIDGVFGRRDYREGGVS